MESNDFVAQEVLSVLDLSREGNCIAVVVLDESLSSPCTVGEEASFVNLEPVEGRPDSGCTVTTAVSEVSDDGTLVGLWPFGPEESDLATSGSWSDELSWNGTLVTNNISASNIIDKAVTILPEWLSDTIWCWVLVLILEGQRTSVSFASNQEFLNITVGQNRRGGREKRNDQSGLHFG
ncbi:hypothetical protein ABW19_dt0201491 [Dactylella cylindrospora]|nr:hypothetical protein ABW19_dt0201491 [Dactylella cylindrospora]